MATASSLPETTASASHRIIIEFVNSLIVSPGPVKSSYVLYSLTITRDPTSDTQTPHFKRRYSDFLRLHKHLTKTYPDTLKQIVFPPKLFSGNFKQETIGRRSLAFEQYLSHICDTAEISNDRGFKLFFIRNELKQAMKLYKANKLLECVPLLKLIQHNMKVLDFHDSNIELLTLCCLSVCLAAIDDMLTAYHNVTAALDLISEDDHILLLPLLIKSIRLSVIVGKERERYEEKLVGLNVHSSSAVTIPTLAEATLKFIDSFNKNYEN